ncbi:MAG TPA: hypothetical protein VIO60_03050 [Rectinemataceae bacterium]
MKKSLAALLALLALGSQPALYASSSSCVDCHADVETMKALVPPPTAASGEGEG